MVGGSDGKKIQNQDDIFGNKTCWYLNRWICIFRSKLIDSKMLIKTSKRWFERVKWRHLSATTCDAATGRRVNEPSILNDAVAAILRLLPLLRLWNSSQSLKCNVKFCCDRPWCWAIWKRTSRVRIICNGLRRSATRCTVLLFDWRSL